MSSSPGVYAAQTQQIQELKQALGEFIALLWEREPGHHWRSCRALISEEQYQEACRLVGFGG